jgi:hypothetical protein
MSALETLRQMLSPEMADPSPRFTSVDLVRPGFGLGVPVVKGGEKVLFKLGIQAEPPDRISGHLFDDDTGCLITRLPSAVVKGGEHSLLCAFTLPQHITAKTVCLVLEGRRGMDEAAGCEVTFMVGAEHSG